MGAVPAPDPFESRCPRCGSAFHCSARDPGPCACAQVSLSPAGLAALQRAYSDCLCLPCLQALATAERARSVAVDRPA